jgi:DMSO reductase anchor subunit
MNPAFSVVFFTTLAGAAQGLVLALALATLGGVLLPAGFVQVALLLALLLLAGGLGASFLHLGRPERAWRAVLMWRTSWLSREVILLPAFMGVVALWWLALWQGMAQTWLMFVMVLAVLLAILLWYCTGMIYACIRFIQEWAHRLTPINFGLIGLSSGLVLGSALAALQGDLPLARTLGAPALLVTLLAWGARMLSLRRNAALKPKSTLQSATGIRGDRLLQKSMGMSAGAFNTREFFHKASAAAFRRIKLAFLLLAFALPALLLACGLATQSTWPWLLACLLQAPGLVAERWFFFAQARHPQNLYYQVVS